MVADDWARGARYLDATGAIRHVAMVVDDRSPPGARGAVIADHNVGDGRLAVAATWVDDRKRLAGSVVRTMPAVVAMVPVVIMVPVVAILAVVAMVIVMAVMMAMLPVVTMMPAVMVTMIIRVMVTVSERRSTQRCQNHKNAKKHKRLDSTHIAPILSSERCSVLGRIEAFAANVLERDAGRSVTGGLVRWRYRPTSQEGD